MKVYCNDCKYFGNGSYYNYDCWHKSNTYYSYDHDGRYVKHKQAASIINRRNGCKKYKRKWWKFWVKGEKK